MICGPRYEHLEMGIAECDGAGLEQAHMKAYGPISATSKLNGAPDPCRLGVVAGLEIADGIGPGAVERIDRWHAEPGPVAIERHERGANRPGIGVPGEHQVDGILRCSAKIHASVRPDRD